MTTIAFNSPGYEVGSVLQAPIPAASLFAALTIAASGQIQSVVIPTNGYKLFALGLQSSQAGAVKIQRFLDVAGTVPQGAVISVSLTGGTAAVINAGTDGLPCASIQITVTNTGGSTATLTNVAGLFQAA